MELDRRKEDRRGRKALRDTIEGGTIDWGGKLWRLISRLVSVLDKALRYLVSYDAISMLGCSRILQRLVRHHFLPVEVLLISKIIVRFDVYRTSVI